MDLMGIRYNHELNLNLENNIRYLEEYKENLFYFIKNTCNK